MSYGDCMWVSTLLYSTRVKVVPAVYMYSFIPWNSPYILSLPSLLPLSPLPLFPPPLLFPPLPLPSSLISLSLPPKYAELVLTVALLGVAISNVTLYLYAYLWPRKIHLTVEQKKLLRVPDSGLIVLYVLLFNFKYRPSKTSYEGLPSFRTLPSPNC